MIELSRERISQILYEETPKKEDMLTLLRSIYFRYMRLYERYFADLDALDDDRIAELGQYREETTSLVKYYYMDLPLDLCMGLVEFERKYGDNLFGPRWREFLFGSYKEFAEKGRNRDRSEEEIKAAFTKETLAAFYDAMDYLFRDDFGTGSQTVNKVMGGITGLLFGRKDPADKTK